MSYLFDSVKQRKSKFKNNEVKRNLLFFFHRYTVEPSINDSSSAKSVEEDCKSSFKYWILRLNRTQENFISAWIQLCTIIDCNSIYLQKLAGFLP